MSGPDSRPASAVEFHDVIAGSFTRRYQESARFTERLAVWQETLRPIVSKDTVVADLGCGPGHLAMFAASLGRSAIGIDGSPEMVLQARRASAERRIENVEFRQAMLEHFRGAEFGPVDVILLSSVLEYVGAPDLLLAECRNALKSSGVLVLSVPNGDSWYRLFERASFRLFGRPRYLRYVRRIDSRSREIRRLEDAGFVVREVRPFAAAPGLSFLFRLVGARRLSDTLLLIVAQRAD